jgi:cardiolipin synthase
VFNLPNILTISRMLTLPVIVGFMYYEYSASQVWAAWVAFGLYVLSAITDFLDGYFARSMNLVTDFGKFLDPISDKIFVATIMIALVGFGKLPDLWIIAPMVIMIREFLVSGIREFLGPKEIKLPVTKLAKWKTTVQMIATGLLVIGSVSPLVMISGRLGLVIAAILTVITGWGYLKAGLKHIQS